MSDDGNGDDIVQAGSTEFLITGCCGIVIFCYGFILAIFGYLSAKSSSSQLFFLGIAGMCSLEMPRYFALAIHQEFTNRVAYGFHILGGAFFFTSLCTVCNMWSSILRLGKIASLFYSRTGLTIAACALGSIQISVFCVCVTSSSLEEFMHSDVYVAFVVEEIFQNLIYSAGLFMFGVKLIIRLDNYAQMSTNIKQLKTVVYRLTATLGITSVASLLRLGMCILQIYSLKGSHPIWNNEFPQYGLLWYLFAEFIPRGISAVALMHLMRNTNDTKKREKLTTGRYALSSSLTSAKKGPDFSFQQQESCSTSPSHDDNRQTLGDSLMNYRLSTDSDAHTLGMEHTTFKY